MAGKNDVVQSVNTDMKGVIGYEPYFVDGNGKVLCTSCHTEQPNTDSETLHKGKSVKGPDGSMVTVHSCPGCKYAAGTNVSLKKRLAAIRKELGLSEFPTGEKFCNKYFTPQKSYMYIVNKTGEATKLTETQMYDAYQDIIAAKEPEHKSSTVATTTSSMEDLKDLPPDRPENVEDHPNLINAIPPTETIVAESKIIPIVETTTVIVDEPVIVADVVEKVEDITAPPEVKASTFFDDDDEDFSNHFKDNTPVVTETIIEQPEVKPPVEVVGESSGETSDADDMMFGIDSDFDNLFNNIAEQMTPAPKSKDIFDLPPTSEDNPQVSSAYADVKRETDPMIASMLKNNEETQEADVFRIDKRDQQGIGNIVRRSRTSDLHDNYNDSNAKIVVDRIVAVFKKRVQQTIRTNLTINELTHECPVVDIEGNIRLIFIDTDIPGGRYSVKDEINNRLKPTFEDTSEFEMMTFVIFSDMIMAPKYINRVVKSIAKHVAFNLKIMGIFNPISIIKESDRYFYTTLENDKAFISKFDAENCAGEVDKPCTGEIAVISQWNNPELDDAWRYQKEIKNRAVIMSGGDVGYKDLGMYMVCTMKYIMLPQKPDGSINVTVTDYSEQLDLFVRDGFGILVGCLVHNIKMQYPNSQIHLYYEIDFTMIPSPTISRYIKSGAIRQVNIDENKASLNKIAAVLANQNGV